MAGFLSDATATKGLGNVGCFMGGGIACALALVLLNIFAKFGDLGKDELIAARRKR